MAINPTPSGSQGLGDEGGRGGVQVVTRVVVLISTSTLAGLVPSSVTILGVKVQLDSAGRLEH
jgi:hypothetical protein